MGKEIIISTFPYFFIDNMTREYIENEASKRYPILHNHIVSEEEVQDARWEGFVEGAEWMLKECKNHKNR